MLKSSVDANGRYAIQSSACQIVGWKPKATDPTFHKLSAGLESVTLLIEKFNLSLCVGKSRLLTQLQTARNNTADNSATFSDLGGYLPFIT